MFPVPVEVEGLYGEDLPMGVADFVEDLIAGSAGAEAPLVFFEVVLECAGGREACGGVSDDAEGVVGAGAGQAVGDGEVGLVVGDFGGHVRRQVGFVVEAAGEPGDEGAWDILADEDDAPTVAVRDVEAEVDFGEVAEAGPADSEDAGLEEVEGDEADVGVAVVKFQCGAGGAVREEEMLGAGVGD